MTLRALTQDEIVAEALAAEFIAPYFADAESFDEFRGRVYIDHTLGHEGGYANRDPKDDPGGETNWGVTIKTARLGGYKGDMRAMTRAEAFDIYFNLFWKPGITSHIKNDFAYQIYDRGVNSGYKNAIILLQRTLKVDDDGIFGVNTANALSQWDPYELTQVYLDTTESWLRTLKHAKANPGWFNRTRSNRTIDFRKLYEDYYRSNEL